MLTRDEALKICDEVLAKAKAAGAEDATVSVRNAFQSHARFADSGTHSPTGARRVSSPGTIPKLQTLFASALGSIPPR